MMPDVPGLRSSIRRPLLAATLVAGLGGVAAVALDRGTLRLVVEGPSMLPVLAPGDRVVAVRTPVLDVGDLVAFADPEQDGRVLVKRVVRLEALSVFVEGDNASASRDSRHFGAVSRRRVLGRVVYRYHPPHQSGWLRQQVRSGRDAS